MKHVGFDCFFFIVMLNSEIHMYEHGCMMEKERAPGLVDYPYAYAYACACA